MLMALNLNPLQRATPNVNTSGTVRIGSPALTDARSELQPKYPTTSRPSPAAVTQFVNTGRVDYDALMLQLKKRFSHNYSAQVSYTYANARGNYSGNGAPVSNFQVGQDMHLELNEGPTDFDIRHNFTVSGTALVPHTDGLNVSWVARALSGSPFSLTNGAIDPDLQRHPGRAAAGRRLHRRRHATDTYTVKDYESKRNGARGPGFFNLDMRFGYRIPLVGAAPRRDRGRCVQPDQPHQLR